MKHLMADLALFGRALGRYWFKRGYRWFSYFEKAKDVVAQVLYRQRGRFARPFVHLGMVGLVALAIVLAPVLASSFPGIEDDPWKLESPTDIVREVTDDGTATVISEKVRDRTIEYEVQEGDTISQIADKFGISTDTIRWENNLSKTAAIKPGQRLKILPVTGVSHKVGRGETVHSIAKKYQTEAQGMVDFPFNTFTDDETFALAAGQTLIVPEGKKPNEVPWSPATPYIAARTPDAGAVSAFGVFAWPIGGVITQRYSWYHKAVDIANPKIPPIVAADSGRVIAVGWHGGYGNRVMVDHDNGYVTLYAHLSQFRVGVGQRVKRGDVLGIEGSTGRSTGPHLHFEIRKNGVAVNPLEYLK